MPILWRTKTLRSSGMHRAVLNGFGLLGFLSREQHSNIHLDLTMKGLHITHTMVEFASKLIQDLWIDDKSIQHLFSLQRAAGDLWLSLYLQELSLIVMCYPHVCSFNCYQGNLSIVTAIAAFMDNSTNRMMGTYYQRLLDWSAQVSYTFEFYWDISMIVWRLGLISRIASDPFGLSSMMLDPSALPKNYRKCWMVVLIMLTSL